MSDQTTVPVIAYTGDSSAAMHQKYFNKGISFTAYLEKMEQIVAQNQDVPYASYIPMNLQRMQRIGKTLVLSDEIKASLQLLHHPIRWLVISEYWCGDASQVLPVINRVAEASSGKIDLRIVFRDINPELMNAHLTGTSQSIPKLIQLDSRFGITGTWGPRPNEAQKLVTELKKDPATAQSYSEHLHKWYAQNKQLAIQRDLNKLLKMAIAFCPDCFAR